MPSPAERQYILAQVSSLAADQLKTLWIKAAELVDVDFAAYVRKAFPELVDPYASMAAGMAANWYDETPTTTTGYSAATAALPEADMLERSAQWALGGSGDVGLDRLTGTMQRAIFNSARDTTVLNTEFEPGARWARHASANACAFCALMATRGVVYATEQSALRVVGRSVNLETADRRAIAAGLTTRDEALQSRMVYRSPRQAAKRGKSVGDKRVGAQRGSRAIGDKYHDHCHCVAIEIRPGGSYEPPPYVQDWDAAYTEASRANRTKGEYDAIDIKGVLATMRQTLGTS